MRRKRFMAAIVSALVVSLLLLMLAGCGEKGTSSEKGRPTTYVDDLGREVRVEQIPQSIISVAPACTEILFGLGLGDRVVGVTEYCDYPEEALSKPKIGTFTNPNIEAIVAAKPDLVLVTGGVQQELVQRMEDLGLTVYAVNPGTFEETLEDIGKIGKMTGAEEEANLIVQDMKARAERIAEAVAEKEASGQPRPRVFYEIFYENNVWTAGKGSIISHLVSLAGGENIGDLESQDYYEFSVERLIAEDPDVYLVGSGSMYSPDDVYKRPGWDRIKAVRNRKVFVIEEDIIYRTGPRLIDGLEAIYDAINS